MTLTIVSATLIAWGGLSPAAVKADVWTGRTTANVNLRSAPGLHGAVITGLPQGTILRVYDEQNGWVKVTRETDTFGYQGWIYGHYVMPVETLPAAASAPTIFSADAPRQTATAPGTAAVLAVGGPQPAIRPATQSAPQPAPSAVPSAAIIDRPVPASPPAPVTAAAPAVPAVPVKTPVPRDVEPAPAVMSTTAALSVENAAALPEPPVTQEILATQPPARPISKTPTGVPASSAAGSGVFAWVSLLLRLSTVALALLALYVANRALQTAREANIRIG